MRKNYFNLILDSLRKKDYFEKKYLLIGVIVLIILILITVFLQFAMIARVDLSPTQTQAYSENFFIIFLRWLGLGFNDYPYEDMNYEDLTIKIIKNDGARGACKELNNRGYNSLNNELCVLCKERSRVVLDGTWCAEGLGR